MGLGKCMMTRVHHYRIIGAFSCPETLLQVSYFFRFREVVEEEDGEIHGVLGVRGQCASVLAANTEVEMLAEPAWSLLKSKHQEEDMQRPE